MDSINYHQIFILLLQAAIVAGLILTLFRIRTIFGLGPLFTALGVFQFIQVFLTSSFYFEVANGIFVSPGNIIFTGGLFAILLIYVREDALEARKVIYAILAANLVMSFMLTVISWGIDLEGVKNIYNFPKEFFTRDSMITIVGTLALLIDVFVIVFLYETVSKYVSQLFLRFFFSMLLVLTLDTLLFSFGIFIGTGRFPETFYASIISKYSSVLVFSLIFSFYLQHYEKLIRRSESKVDSFKDIFYKLTFRQKFEQVSSKNVQLYEQIKENEIQFQSIFEQARDGIVIFSKDRKLLLANAELINRSGYSKVEFLSLKLSDIFKEASLEESKERIKDLLRDEIVPSFEAHLLTKKGQLIPVEISVSMLKNLYGFEVVFQGIVRDITERKQAEETLKENYALLKIAGKTAKLGGWNVNLKENLTYWSDEVAAIHEMPAGYAPLVEESIRFYAPEWRDKITEVFTNCAQKGIPYDEDMEIITSKGNRIWVRTIGEAVRDNQGNIVKVQGAFQDISERKHSELLRNSEKYLLEIITQNTPFPKILEEIVLTVEALSEKTTIASILLLDDDGIHVHYGAAPHLPEAYNNALEGAPIGPNAGSCGTAAYRKEAVIVTDIEVDPLWDDYRELARAYGLRACWSTPIINSEGKVLGTFAMYYREPRTPKEEDFVLIERATHLAKIAIERNLKEQELEKSQRLLLESQRIGKVGGWEFNIDTMKQTWTEEVYRIHEVEDDYKPTVETGVNYYTPESRPVIEQAVQRAIEFGEPFDLELEIITAKGNFRSVKTIGEADLEHRRIFGFFQDITERKLAVEELHESEEKFRTLIMASSDSVYRMSPDWSVMYELDGRGFIVNTAKPNAAWFQEYIPPDDQVYVMAVIQEAIRTKSLFELEHRVWRIDGSFGWTFSRAIPRLDANGEIFEWFGAASDVTDRKQAEEKLKETFTLLHIAGEIAKLGGWNVNLKENSTYWSDQVAAIHEMPAGYVPPVEKGILFYAPEWRNKITEVFANCAQNGISYDEEMEIITSKGNRVWVRTIGKAVRDNKGKIVKVQGAFQDITVRKQAENEIQAKHKLVVNTLESMSDAFVSLDKNWCYTYMNEKAGKIFNRDPKEMIGKNIWTEFPEGVGQPFQKNYEKVMREKVFIQLEEYYEPYNLWFENRINPTEDGIAIFFQDITERKQAEENLRLSNQTIKNILDFSPAFIYIFNLNGEFLLVNKKFEKLLGTTQEELLGQTREKYFPKEIAEQHRNNDLLVINSKQALFFEEENMEADGKHFYLTSKFPLFDAKGEIYAVGGISADISDRKKAEEEIYNANRELQMLNNAILYLVSSQDMNLTLNKVLEIAIEVVGLEGGTICLINPDDTFNLVVERGASQEILEDFTNNKVKIGECLCGNCALDCNPLILDSQDEVLKYATREVHRDDGIRFHAAFPFVAEGKSIGVLCVFTRTDTKPTPRSLKLLETIVLQTSIVIDNLRLYDEINNQNVNLEKIVALRTQQLESANKELQTFTYSVSHDLKAPLRGIDGYSNLLMELYSGSLNEEAQYFIHSIRKGTIHMNKLINDLLDYSRLERATLRLESIKIKELLKMLKTQFECIHPTNYINPLHSD